MKKALFILLIGTSVLNILNITACTPTTATHTQSTLSIGNLSPTEANAMLSNKQAVIVDVREDNEWTSGHIAGAIHIPLGQIDSRFNELSANKNTPIIMQCRSGKRSAKAAQILADKGFSKVYNLDGGISAWQNAGLPVQQ